ncbi:hypothetical protein QBC39DRAFT_291514 [Podospora conica]|nr:hypothetical protein QBC39DRAFT_291514 [Schizothecium conicum]
MDMPLDIWLTTLQHMAAGGDFQGLFRLAQTSRTFAYFALPLLYEYSSDKNTVETIDGGQQNLDLDQSVMWWRSAIISTLGQTYQPYYVFIKTLDLRLLYTILLRFRKTKSDRLGTRPGSIRLYDAFFSPPLQGLEIPPRARSKTLHSRAIFEQAVTMFEDQLQKAGAVHDGITALAASEGSSPSIAESHWTPRLTSLLAEESYILTGDLGLAIGKTCPRFKELSCDVHHHKHPNKSHDQLLGMFIQGLAPNSLETFGFDEGMGFDSQTFLALRRHGMSLKHLRLGHMQTASFGSITLTGHLANLESISLGTGWWGMDPGPRWGLTYQNLVIWFRQQVSLKKLDLHPFSSQFVQEVLSGSEIKLTSLRLEMDNVDYDNDSAGLQDQVCFYNEIGRQSALRILELETKNEEDSHAANDEAHPLQLAFVDSLTRLTELRIIFINIPISCSNFARVVDACPHIEEISFFPTDPDGPVHDTEWLESIKRLRSLKKLEWISATSFTAADIIGLVMGLADDPDGRHKGFFMTLGRQGPPRFSDHEEAEIRSQLSQRLEGTLSIDYYEDE